MVWGTRWLFSDCTPLTQELLTWMCHGLLVSILTSVNILSSSDLNCYSHYVHFKFLIFQVKSLHIPPFIPDIHRYYCYGEFHFHQSDQRFWFALIFFLKVQIPLEINENVKRNCQENLCKCPFIWICIEINKTTKMRPILLTNQPNNGHGWKHKSHIQNIYSWFYAI